MSGGKPLQSDDPQRIGPYEIVGRLGEGGQGVVYLGRHSDPNQSREYRAIKLLHVKLSGRNSARARFIREAHAAMRVSQFCTARVYDADVSGDRPYIVSEYVRGPSLQALVAKHGPRRGEQLQQLALGTASALVAIHDAGIIHRDFKPHNVLVGPDGPRVIDFGLARTLDATASLTTGAVGTPAYMAPEQLGGSTVGPAADVFSWGATIAYTATGRPPFGADSIPAVVGRILREEPDLGDLDGSLRTLVAAALAKDAAERPTVRQVVQHLLSPDKPYEPTLSSHVLFTGAAIDDPTADPTAAGTPDSPQPATDRRPVRLTSARNGGTPRTEPAGAALEAGAAAPHGAAVDRRAPRGAPGGPAGPEPAPRPVPEADAATGHGRAAAASPDRAARSNGVGRRAAPGWRSMLSWLTGEPGGHSGAPSPVTAGRHRANPRMRTSLVIALWATAAVALIIAIAMVAGVVIDAATPQPPTPGSIASPAPPPSGSVAQPPEPGAGPGRESARGPQRSRYGPVDLGRVDPTGYCRFIKRGEAAFRAGRWICVGDPPRTSSQPFAMTTVCRWQYGRLRARAEVNGDVSNLSNWRCVV